MIEFDLETPVAWLPGLNSNLECLTWLKDKSRPALSGNPDLTGFPAMLRRRLGPAGKAAVGCLLQLQNLRSTPVTDAPHLFYSQFGEANRSVKLLSDLAAENALSPTEFSLSVHNAAAGVYSIGLGLKGNITALAAGGDGLATVFLEAFGLLKQKHSEVVCVCYDAPLGEPYPAAERTLEYHYALAFVLKTSGQGQKGCARVKLAALPLEAEKAQKPVPAAEVLMKFLLDPQSESVGLTTGRSSWKLERDPS